MGQDYYSILGIKRNATLNELNKAFRRLALKYHPLKCEPGESAVEKFLLICEAYDALYDPQRRAIFDQFGEEGLKHGCPGEDEWIKGYVYHGDANRTFKEFFGGDNPFKAIYTEMDNQVRNNFGGINGRGQMRQDASIERELYLTLEEVYSGCIKKMKISRRVMNSDGHTSTIRD
ncbi:unnamed protein product, partial [Protopolystoma xenopodis]